MKALHQSPIHLIVLLLLFLGLSFCAPIGASVGQWTSQGPLSEWVPSLAAAPTTPSTLFLGSQNHGIFKSTDGGHNWVSMGMDVFHCTHVAVDPQWPSRVYAWAGFADGCGLYRSEDGGTSWLPAVGASPFAANSSPYDLAFAPPAASDSAIQASTVYALLGKDLFRSVDGGAEWVKSASFDYLLRSLVIDPLRPNIFYTSGITRGLSKSVDAGVTWNEVTIEGFDKAHSWTLYIHPTSSGLLARTQLSNSADILLRSTDGAQSWSVVLRGHNSYRLGDVVFSPARPDIVYTSRRGRFFMPDNGFFISNDGGVNWTPIAASGLGDDRITAMAPDTEQPLTLYVGTEAGGVYKSTDGGGSFSETSSGLSKKSDVLSIGVDPGTPTTLYAGEFYGRSGSPYRSGVRRSDDGGVTWGPFSPVSRGEIIPHAVFDLLIDPETPSHLYAGTHRGVYRSMDGGQLWQPMNQGLNKPVTRLVLDPLSPSDLYAAANTEVYRWRVDSSSWELMFSELEAPIRDMTLASSTSTTLHLATRGAGVHDLTLIPKSPRLELGDQRFHVEVDWNDGRGHTGQGIVAPLPSAQRGALPLKSRDSAVLSLFQPDNWEMLITVLDGRQFNDRFWVYLAAATNVELRVQVTDTSCGETWTYNNPLGAVASAATDVEAFDGCSSPLPPTCVADEQTICLGEGDRFQVKASWFDFRGSAGSGRQVLLAQPGLTRSDDSGLFYFFSEDNWELLVKVLDGCEINHRFWVFSAGTTDVEYTLRVTDTATNTVRTYKNPSGTAAAAVTDTSAFASCAIPRSSQH